MDERGSCEDSLMKCERARVGARIVKTIIAVTGLPSYFSLKSSLLGIFSKKGTFLALLSHLAAAPAGSLGSRGAKVLDGAQQMLRDANVAEAL